MALTFRPATPADAPAIAPLVYRSGPAAFDHAFARGGRSAVDFLRWTLAREAGEFGYRLHWVGEQDGRIVATGTAFSGEANLRNSLAALGQIVGFYGFGAAAVIRRGLQLERIIQPPPRRHLLPRPPWRGRGPHRPGHRPAADRPPAAPGPP
ncbi:hypothetical protein [Pseudomonas sp. zfem005]|uniref:hypothetical protein n=1 Tax=Pseudomonas sp. zfem005 TaxID=3078200 RepID=UPI0029288BC7|nr:hypothetical protein [Pseudomonas sp. zfem005]MDU9413455.1 hypothetical protein [Pseudomonas sp. zfem005]